MESKVPHFHSSTQYYWLVMKTENRKRWVTLMRILYITLMYTVQCTDLWNDKNMYIFHKTKQKMSCISETREPKVDSCRGSIQCWLIHYRYKLAANTMSLLMLRIPVIKRELQNTEGLICPRFHITSYLLGCFFLLYELEKEYT